MPNYVQNVLTLSGEQADIASLLAFVKGKNGLLDFNTLIPMPESLAIVSGSLTEPSYAAYAYKAKGEATAFLVARHKEYCAKEGEISLSGFVDHLVQCGDADYDLGQAAYENKRLYGATDWYDWCVGNWGTKWNAMEVDISLEDNTIRFQTAWSAPTPVIEKLAKLFPDVNIHHIWSDEGIGQNCGDVLYIGGIEYDCIPNDDSQEAFALYIECWGDSECIGTDESGDYYRKKCESCDGCS
jgi:hypothetical protein